MKQSFQAAIASGTRKDFQTAGRHQRISSSREGGGVGWGEELEEQRPAATAWPTRPLQAPTSTSAREPDGRPAGVSHGGNPKGQIDASGTPNNNKGGDGSSGTDVSSTLAGEQQLLNALGPDGGIPGQAQQQLGAGALQQTGAERAQRTAKMTAIAALLASSSAQPSRQKNSSPVSAVQQTGDRATITTTTNNNQNNNNISNSLRARAQDPHSNGDINETLQPGAPLRWWGAFGKRGGTGAVGKRPARQPTDGDLNDQQDLRPPKATRHQNRSASDRSASLSEYRQIAAEATAAATAQYGSLLKSPSKASGSGSLPPWSRQQHQQQQQKDFPHQQNQLTHQQSQQQQQQPAATSHWRKKTRELRISGGTGGSNAVHHRPSRPGHVVAHEAAELPPDQLCNPLIILSLLALSRKAAEQHCKEVFLLLPSIRRQTSAAAQRGILEAEQLARKTAEAQLATLQRELATAHLKIQELRAGPRRGPSKAATTSTNEESEEAEKARLLRLAADADVERSLRKAAQAALAEAEGSIESLATSAAEAEKAKADTQANLARMEELFRRERRAWEYDALDLETLAARSKGETLMVETSLKEAERRNSEIQEELKVEKAIKERAMAFISQRALMSSQEQESLMERHLNMPSSIPSAFDQNPRKVHEAAAQAAAAAFAAAAAAEAVAIRAAQQTQQQQQQQQQQHPAPPPCLPYVRAASLVPNTAAAGSGGGSVVRPVAHYGQAAAPRKSDRDPASQVSFHRSQSDRSPTSASDN